MEGLDGLEGYEAQRVFEPEQRPQVYHIRGGVVVRFIPHDNLDGEGNVVEAEE